MAEIPPTQSTDETPEPTLEVIEPAEAAAPAETGRPTQPPAPVWIVLILVAFALGLSAGYMIWAQPLQSRAAAAEQKVAILEKTASANSTAVAQQAVAQQAGEQPTAVSGAAVETTATANEQAAGPTAEATAQKVKRYDVPIADNYILGSSTAAITLIEFSDYECPFCRRWHEEVWTKLQTTYGDKIRLVYRDFPLYSIHSNAIPAAEAANCAGEQKKYYEFHDLLLSGDGELSKDVYLANAKKLSLNVDSFKKCVDERRYQSEVEADLTYASDLGVRSTPTFFINGLAVVGAQPFEVFQQIIDLELAGKIPK